MCGGVSAWVWVSIDKGQEGRVQNGKSLGPNLCA